VNLTQCLTMHQAVKAFGRENYSSTPQPLHPRGKTKKVPIANEAAWAPELVWTLFKREKLPLPGIEPGYIKSSSRFITCKSKWCVQLSYLPGKSTKKKFNGIGNRFRPFSRHCDERDKRFSFSASPTTITTHTEA